LKQYSVSSCNYLIVPSRKTIVKVLLTAKDNRRMKRRTEG
jgi:hypothetical protein